VPDGVRGFALAIVILILLVLSLFAVLFMRSITVDTTVSGYGVLESKALTFADAGIAEAIARIRSGDVPDTLNPRMVTQIYLAVPGAVPALGADSTAIATAQPAGSWLNYSTAARSSDVLTVTYKTDPTRTQIYRYDGQQNPAIQFDTGNPIFVISSVGRVGSARSHVVAEVVRSTGSVTLHGGVTAGYDYKTTGACLVCGYNHRGDTPWDQGATVDRTAVGGCGEAPDNWETGSGDLPAIWSTGTITFTNPGNRWYGVPDATEQSQPVPFYAGPWEVLGMSESAFYTWLGPRTNTLPAAPSGIVHIDNDDVHHNQSGSWNYSTNGVYGTGFLYVDGSLSVSGSLHFKGLIYTENYFKLTNNSWILGGVVAKGGFGTVQDGLTNTTRVLYSADAISQYVGTGLSSSGIVTLSWREVGD